MSVLGLDIGTSGCKASVIDAEGHVAAQAYREYALSSPGPGMEEIDPELVWQSSKEVISRAAAAARAAGPVEAISVSSFGEAIVPVDSSARPLRNAILYIDRRGAEEASALGEALGEEHVQSITGARVHSMYSIAKLLWMKGHEAGTFSAADKFLLLADYALARLGARPHTDYSLAARTQAFDVSRKAWSPEILGYAGLDPEKLGEPVQAGAVVGELGRGLASELGLKTGALLVAGGHDQCCAALGAGVVGPGAAVDGLGSTECVTPAFDRPIIDDRMGSAGFACVPHVMAGLYVTYAFTFTCGSLLKWFRDEIAPDLKALAEREGRDAFELLVAEASEREAPLLLLPHFAGAATPYMDALARGALVGLSLDTTRGDILRAILEGVTYEMMVNVERLEEAGIAVSELRAVGGLAKSDRFLQLKADMMGRPLAALDGAEAGTLGVAMLAGVAAGLYPDLATAARSLPRTRRVFEPDMAAHGRYAERFEAYKRLYPAMREIARARKEGSTS
jgi:Sugar (pentulose and hexulose) kinases